MNYITRKIWHAIICKQNIGKASNTPKPEIANHLKGTIHGKYEQNNPKEFQLKNIY